MTKTDLELVIHTLAGVLDANANQRLTLAMVRGIMLVVEHDLIPHVEDQPVKPETVS